MHRWTSSQVYILRLTAIAVKLELLNVCLRVLVRTKDNSIRPESRAYWLVQIKTPKKKCPIPTT